MAVCRTVVMRHAATRAVSPLAHISSTHLHRKFDTTISRSDYGVRNDHLPVSQLDYPPEKLDIILPVESSDLRERLPLRKPLAAAPLSRSCRTQTHSR